jgi:geranylgeranyl diphosphate synthase type II
MPGENRFTLVEEVLHSYKTITTEAMLALMPSKEPRRYLYDLVPSYPRREGKGFRPGLCIATCRAFGGTTRQALNSAVALELFHNAFLIHDDVEDGSDFRRGKPTMNAEYGLPIAVNVGDAMNVLSLRPLMDNLTILGPALSLQIFAEIEHMVRESVEGQALELGWVRDNLCAINEDDYLRMTLKKTCWYTCIHPCRIGALIATGGEISLDRFNRFGYYMGVAFQIQDDILNLIGDQGKYGKEIGGDIWEGKRTMILIHLLNHCKAKEKEWLRVFLARSRQERTAEAVHQVYTLMDKYGSLDAARSSARQLAGAALREFLVAYGDRPDSRDKEMIQSLVEYMIERDL